MMERRSLGERFVNSKFSEQNRVGRVFRHIFVADHKTVSIRNTQPTGTPETKESTVRRFLVFGRKQTISSIGDVPRKEK